MKGTNKIMNDEKVNYLIDMIKDMDIENKLRLANFPYKKYIEDLDMESLPEDGRKKLKNFLTLEFIKTRTEYNISWKSRNW